MEENSSSERLSRIGDFIQNERKKPLEKYFIRLSGANIKAVDALPEQEKQNIRTIGMIAVLLGYIFLAGAIFYFITFFDSWLLMIFFLIIASTFLWLLQFSVGVRSLHESVSLYKLYLARFVTLILLLFACTGIVMWMYPGRINLNSKLEKIKPLNRNYIHDLYLVDTSSESYFKNYAFSLAQHEFTSGISRLSPAQRNFSVRTIDDSLRQARQTIGLKVSEVDFIESKLTFLVTVAPPEFDTSLNSLLKGFKEYPHYSDMLTIILDNNPVVKKNKNFYEYADIVFTQSGRSVSIIQNYYDSLYKKRLELFLLSVKVDYLENMRSPDILDKLILADRTELLPDPLPNLFAQLNNQTKGWLASIMIVSNRPLKAPERFASFYSLALKDDKIGVTLIIVYLVIILLLFFSFSLVTTARQSDYPELVHLYKKRQFRKTENIRDTLRENILIRGNEKKIQDPVVQVAEEPRVRYSNDKSAEDIAAYFFETGADYEENGRYENALEIYSKGIESYPDELEFLRKKAEVFNKMGKTSQSIQFFKLYTEEINKRSFKDNLEKKLQLEYVELESHSFYGHLHWHLNPQMNILLGKNGYGKSHLLSIILSLIQNNDSKTKEFNTDSSKAILSIKPNADKSIPFSKDQLETLNATTDPDKRSALETEFTIKNHTISFSNANGLINRFGKIPVLAIPDCRFIDKSGKVFSRPKKAFDLLEESAYHFLYQELYGDIIENAFYRICITYSQQTKKPAVIELVESIFKKLTGGTFTVKDIKSKLNAEFEVLVSTEGSESIALQKVSQGTFSVISIVCLIYNYLRERYTHVAEKDVLIQQAIVFIDELDAHIHPSWQQKFVNILRNTFPKVQFIITGHSPLIVAGCKEKEVSVLRKGENKFEINMFEHHFIGYQPEEIYQMIFDVESYDETFLKYNAMLAFKPGMEEEKTKLEKLTSLSTEQKEKLASLSNDIYYMNLVARKSEETIPYHKLHKEVESLKKELEVYKSKTAE